MLDSAREHPAFRRHLVIVAHADWGVDPRKRWVSVASGDMVDGWSAVASSPMREAGDLRSTLGVTASQTLVLGFDFPIGLPRRYADRAGISRFLDTLPDLGRAEWADFFSVADSADEISIRRPFYPRTARIKGTKRQADLTTALGLTSNDLRRRCEDGHPGRSAACPLFWTIGGNQVGKGALAGWQMLQAHPRDALAFWPFEGGLHELLESRGAVVAETYPAEFYGHLGLPRLIGKRRQANRAALSAGLCSAADQLNVRLEHDLRQQIDSGFGVTRHGEDAFDAFVGLLGMINVLSGGRSSGEPRDDESVTTVEGWILGQDDMLGGEHAPGDDGSRAHERG